MRKNLVLTGMMGVGKSTIGKTIAKRLNMTFIDVDNLIVQTENQSINKIFKEKGEKYYRDKEKSLTLINIQKKNCVISLGGGAFMDTQIRSAALKSCCCFWLKLETKELIKRLNKNNKRPLLNQNNLEKTLDEILNKRKDFYKLAHFKINCKNLNKALVIDKIINIYADKKD